MDKRRYALTVERVKQLLRYDPETGDFYNLVKRVHLPVGLIKKKIKPSGYYTHKIDCVPYLAHRLAWLYMTGKWPQYHIDHINGIGHDNRWVNLRDVPQRDNVENRHRPRSDNRLGVMGVKPNWNKKKFVAYIRAGERRFHIGTYDTVEEAHRAYIETKRKLHEGCTI